MMTNPLRDAVYTVTVPADLTASVLAACRAEAAAGIKRTPTPMMRVLPPLTAAAACAAVLGVALYLGGNTPDDLPVLPPVGNESTTTEVTEPTDSTAKPTTMTTTTKPTTTTAKPTTTTTTTAKPTTTTTTEPYILVGGEDDYEGSQSEGIPSLKDRLVSPALEEKMKEYRDVNAVYQVVIFLPSTVEDGVELRKFLESDEEYQSLKKQYKEAEKAEKEASDRLHDAQVINANKNEPQIDVTPLEEEYRKAKNIRNELSVEFHALEWEVIHDHVASRNEERISYAAKYSKTEPIRNYCEYPAGGYGCYMELTADAINELADRGGYDFFLASKLDSYRLGFFNE